MPSIVWTGGSKKIVRLTKNNGTTLVLQSEWTHENSGVLTRGNCINIDGKEYKIVGFRHGGGPPESIILQTWENNKWNLDPIEIRLPEDSSVFEKIIIINCPTTVSNNNKKFRNRKTRNRKTRNRKTRNRTQRN